MKIPKCFRHLVFLTLAIWNLTLSAQKYEAETGILTPGASVEKSTAASGGAYVAMKDGNLKLEIELENAGYFSISISAAAPNGFKTNTFKINGASVEFSYAQNNNFIKKLLVSDIRLAKGKHTLEVVKSWGWINIDFFELTKAEVAEINPREKLVTPNPTPQAQKLYRFLLDHYGKKIISGVMTLNSMDEVNWLKTNTGKEPALVGIDFMHCGRNYSWYNDQVPMNDARNYYNRNGIPALCWHWRDPSRKTEEFYTSKTSFDISKVNDSTSTEYKAMIKDIDYIAAFFLKLQSDSVAIIWRPLHEAAGGWFWWGAKGAAPCKKLYQVMWKRMVEYHGIRNLIWVWTREPGDEAWYPGDEYIDIVGRDIYRQGDFGSQILEFNQTNNLYKGNKLLTISECGSFPDPDNLEKDGAPWSYFMPWYGDFVRKNEHNPLTHWKKTLNHSYVLTLDEMPNLRTYPKGVSVQENRKPGEIRVFPTVVNRMVHVRSEKKLGEVSVYNASGRKVFSDSTEQNQLDIDLGNFLKGVYLLKVEGADSVRLIKQ